VAARTRNVARTVGRYEILEELGRGGMATVFLAHQTDLDRSVALKELSAFRQSDPSFVQRFLRESRLAGSLSHPNIVTVLDYFEDDGTPYIAMEYVDGGSLRPHIGHMSLTQVAGVLEGMLSALDHAHGRQVVHRDLKPENVMVTSDGRVKLTDFGIAKATGTVTTGSFRTATGMTVGTPNYMAPEQAMGQAVGPWTDLYSAGVMAFEMFVGQVPFHDTEEPVAILMRQISDEIPPARSVNPELDPAISDWIERLLVKDPDERTQSAHDAWDELEEIVIGLVGPRWRRSARLLEPSRRPADAPAGPATPPPTGAARPPLMPTLDPPLWAPTGQSTAPTRRLREDPGLAGTVMPEAPTRRLDRDTEVQDERPAKRRALGMAKPALALFVVLFALAAVLGSRSSQPGPSSGANVETATVGVSGPDLSLKVPRGWSRVPKAPDLGLRLAHASAAAPGGRAAGSVVEFGLVKGGAATNSALLPAAFLGSIGQSASSAPPRTAVRLPAQNLQAWRYGKLSPVGAARQVTVYTVPTSVGVATVVCAAPPARAALLGRQCDAIAGTLQLRRGTPYTIGPSDAYATSLNGTIGDLQQTTQTGEQSLQASTTLAGQAAAAQSLASAYAGAAAQLSALNLSPADRATNAQLVDALRGAARAYRTAARAATGGNADAYRAASAAIPNARAKVNTALAAIGAAGYKPATGGGSTPPATGAPKSNGPAQTQTQTQTQTQSDVGDSRSDDPSDDSADP
jgi:predicted Ser/Thr protein kinase